MTTFPASSANEALIERVRANLTEVCRRIASCGRDPASVRVVAVTKTFGADEVRAAYSLGLRHFGENYVDELCEKRSSLVASDVAWHFLGALQTNKIPRAVRCADVLSGVSRARELDKISAAKSGATIDIQVDFTGAAQRNGAPPDEVEGLVVRARELNLKFAASWSWPRRARREREPPSPRRPRWPIGSAEGALHGHERRPRNCSGTGHYRAAPWPRALRPPTARSARWPNMVPGVLPRRRG